ncbi:MAG: outer membrane beta-barrel protein [Bacteroidetes bacterium]|nr:outer membrane beta-barrel protein [Bacteroidota bacterium]
MSLPRIAPLALLFFLTAASDLSLAQFRSEFAPTPPPDVLSPAPSRWWIGPQLGAGLNTHSGDFVTDFCNCGFEDGSGTGFAIGFEVGHFLSESFAVALKLAHNDFRADYAYRLILPTEVIDEQTMETMTIDVEHERRNTVVVSYLMLNPVLQFYPFSGLYVHVGPAVGVNTTATQEYAMSAVGEEYSIYIGDPESRIVDEDSGDLPGAESFRADLRFGLGFNIRLGRNILFSPEASYAYPLTRISDDDNWTAESILLLGVLKFEL